MKKLAIVLFVAAAALAGCGGKSKKADTMGGSASGAGSASASGAAGGAGYGSASGAGSASGSASGGM